MKDFQLLVNKNIITKLAFDVNKVPGTKEEGILYLINMKLITQPGEINDIKTWWDSPESNLLDPDTAPVQTTLNTGEKADVLADNPETVEKEQDRVLINTVTDKPSNKKSNTTKK